MIALVDIFYYSTCIFSCFQLPSIYTVIVVLYVMGFNLFPVVHTMSWCEVSSNSLLLVLTYIRVHTLILVSFISFGYGSLFFSCLKNKYACLFFRVEMVKSI